MQAATACSEGSSITVPKSAVLIKRVCATGACVGRFLALAYATVCTVEQLTVLEIFSPVLGLARTGGFSPQR